MGCLCFLVRARGVERAEKKTCRWHVFPLRRESTCAAAEGSARAERLPSPYRKSVPARGVEGEGHAYRHGLQARTRLSCWFKGKAKEIT